ncbi:MAG: DUF885 domain-containing protein [Myxococcaceae bacterium]
MRHLAVASLLIATSCATLHGSNESMTQSARLNQIVERWFDEHLELNPLEATYIGDHRFDDRFGNPASPEYDEKTRSSWERAKAQVTAIDPATLSPEDQLTREVFLYDANDALEGLQFPERLLPMNQMDGPLLDLAKFGSGESAQPFKTVEDHKRWLKRAEGFRAWVDSAIAAMREGQGRGITLPRVAMDNVLQQVDGFAKTTVEDSVFWKPLASLKPEDRAKLEPQYRRVFATEVMPAMVKLRDFLRDEHLPKCRESVGWSALPDGARWYAWHVKHSTTTELTPDQIHEMGKKEVARILSGIEEVRAELAFKGTLQQFFGWARDNPELYFKKPEDLLSSYHELKKRIDGQLPTLFSVFPKADYEIRPVEAFRAESAPGAEYEQPSQDGTRPGIFYVNTFNLKAQPRYGMQTLSLHEASPGHHFQVALQQELKLPRFRRFGGYTAYAEGWALYSETLGKQLGLYQTPMDYYGHLADGQLRAMRLVVDTGLHAKGWTREQAIQFMLDNSSMAESDVTAEVERYLVWPGQALGYKVGQLRILAMRSRAEQALGPKFDVKAFHAAVLTNGALPMDVLEHRIDQLIANGGAIK